MRKNYETQPKGRWIKIASIFVIFVVLSSNPYFALYSVGRSGTRRSNKEAQETIGVIIELKGGPLAEHIFQKKAKTDYFLNKIQLEHKRVKKEMATFELKIKREYFSVFDGFSLEMPKNMLEKIRSIPDVKKIYNDTAKHILLTKNIQIIGADKVWNLYDFEGKKVTGRGIVVSVIDTGIDYNHSDLGGPGFPNSKIIGGYDFVNNDPDPMDDHNHGTHCAGIIAANGTLKGVAPDAMLLAYKAFNADGYGKTSDCIAAIEASVENGSDVISMSWGGDEESLDSPLSQALENAMSLGVICVAAAGNSGPGYESVIWPAAHPDVIAVGATDKSDVIASFSSRGPTNLGDIKPEVLAPGVDIYSTIRNNSYAYMSGTSMACPHVSGSAALLLQMHPDWTQKEVKKALMNGALDLGYDAYTQGAGRIDVYASAIGNLTISPTKIKLERISHKDVPIVLENSGEFPISYNTSVECVFAPPGWDDVDHFPVDYVAVSPGNGTIAENSTLFLNLTFNIPQNATKGYYTGTLRIFTAEKNYSIPFSFGVGEDIIINTTERWENLSMIVNGNISIENAGDLEIHNVTFIMTGLYSGQYAVRVKNAGELKAFDSTITSYSHCFKNKVEIYGSALIERSKINRTSGIRIYSDNVRIANSTIRHDWKVESGGFGYTPGYGLLIYCYNSSPEIYGNKITITPNFTDGYGYSGEGPHFKAIYLKDSSPKIEKNNITLRSVLSCGVYSINSSPKVVDNEIYMPTAAHSFGIYSKISSFKAENLSIKALENWRYEYGIEAYNSSITLFNSSISVYTSESKNARLYEESNISFVNVRTATSTYYISENSSLYIKWFLNVRVVNILNEGLPGVNISVKNAFNRTVFFGLTGEDGWIRRIICTEKLRTYNATIYHTPHNVSAYNATIYKYKTEYMDANKSITFIFGEKESIGIRINNNTDFEKYAETYGWEGNGTETNPYIIENYDIDSMGATSGIYVGNTTVYFIIRNCTIYNTSYLSKPYFSGAGITFYNVRNGTALNNTIFDCYHGIYLYNSKNITMTQNKIHSNYYYGIYVYTSIENNILENTLERNQYGIYLRLSSKNKIYKNLLDNNVDGGLYMSSSEENLIEKNNVFNNEYGIYSYYSNKNNITENTVINCSRGVYLMYSKYFNTTFNNIKNNTYGIYLFSSIDNSMFSNNFINNTYPAYDDSGNNSWNTSYPTGGNYWSDYNGTDIYSGPGQNITGSDGIGDTPYTNILGGSGAQDYYPLMSVVNIDTYAPTFSGLKEIRNIGDGSSLNLSWDPASDQSTLITYNIYRSTTPGGEDFSQPIANTTQTYFIETGLTEGATYYYVVRAEDSAGNEDNNTVELGGTPCIQWYFQKENSDVSGYKALTNLTVYPLDSSAEMSMSLTLDSIGQYYLGGSFMSEPFQEDVNISGNWTFNAYIWVSEDKVHGHPYGKVYRYVNGTSSLLFVTGEDDDDPAYYTDGVHVIPHLFRWNFTVPAIHLETGDRIYVEIWENVTYIENPNSTYKYPMENTSAYYCDVNFYPPEGENLNEKNELNNEDYNMISSSDNSYYHSPSPGIGDKVFMWFDTRLNESAYGINQMTLSFEGHPSKNGTLYLYIYNWTADKWEINELVCDDFTTSDKVLKATIDSGFTNYVNSSHYVRWGVYSEISNASLYVDYVYVNVVETVSGRFFLAYDSESYDSSVIPSLGYGGPRMNITVHSGWNLITLPWQSTSISIEDALSSISWDRAMVYLNNTWYTYNSNRDARYNLGFPMVDNTIGIWVNCTAPGTLSGPDQNLGNTSVALHKGWNLVGYPSNSDRKVSDALLGIPWLYLQTADANGNLYTLSLDDYLIVGRAYWLYVSEDCVWTVGW